MFPIRIVTESFGLPNAILTLLIGIAGVVAGLVVRGQVFKAMKDGQDAMSGAHNTLKTSYDELKVNLEKQVASAKEQDIQNQEIIAVLESRVVSIEFEDEIKAQHIAIQGEEIRTMTLGMDVAIAFISRMLHVDGAQEALDKIMQYMTEMREYRKKSEEQIEVKRRARAEMMAYAERVKNKVIKQSDAPETRSK